MIKKKNKINLVNYQHLGQSRKKKMRADELRVRKSAGDVGHKKGQRELHL